MTRYDIIKRRALLPGQGRKVGTVYIVRDKISRAEVATCASLREARAKASHRNGVAA